MFQAGGGKSWRNLQCLCSAGQKVEETAQEHQTELVPCGGRQGWAWREKFCETEEEGGQQHRGVRQNPEKDLRQEKLQVGG